MVGSHIDSQPTGGKFDGPLGVLAGLESVEAIIALWRAPAPIHRRRFLDERGRLALRAGHDGIGGVLRRAEASRIFSAFATRTAISVETELHKVLAR